MKIKNIVSVFILFLLVGCTVGKGHWTVLPTETVTTSPLSISSIAPILTETSAPDLHITAMVMDVSLSARIIFLRVPVDGFDTIVLAEGCELVFDNGSNLTLRQIQPGSTIQVIGQPGASNALLASRVIVLKDLPVEPESN